MMAEESDDLPPENEGEAPRPRRRRWPWVLLLALPLLAIAYLWISREKIADSLIQDQLKQSNVEASYQVEQIGTGRQVLSNVVIGDPKRPDLTVERIEVEIVPRFGLPGIRRIVLVRPRLFGSYIGGKLSFGKLDPLIFTGSKEPFRLPDYDVELIDGRGRLVSDFGPAGIAVAGKGHLRDGFAGTLAALMPEGKVADCRVGRASIYGAVKIKNEEPSFTGPMRLAMLDCPKQKLRLADAAMQLDARAAKQFDAVEGKAFLTTGALALGSNRAGSAGGNADFTLRKGALTARYDLAGKQIVSPQATFASLGIEGMLRTREGLDKIDADGTVDGHRIVLGSELDRTLAGLEKSGEGTLAAPLTSSIRMALRRELAGGSLDGSFVFRRTDNQDSMVVPQAAIRGASGQALLALSRLQVIADGGPPRISANFATGGPGLPHITGRAERNRDGGITTRLAMAEYSAGESRLALPELTVVQSAGGTLGFAGSARLSGPLPEGAVRGLVVPIDGNWSPGKGLAMWRKCVPLAFDSFSFADLTLAKRSVTLCPPGGQPVLASGAGGFRFAAGLPALDVSGQIGKTPLRLTSGPLGLAWPGVLAARKLEISLGDPRYPSRFRIGRISGKLGAVLSGTFSDTDVLLDAVPLDVLGTHGDWRFSDGRLSIANASFRLQDRSAEARFQPLSSEGATLQLAGNVITADAMLREPKSAREVVSTAIRHDLGSERGEASLNVPGIVFDDNLQPDTITRLALGVVANAKGTVRGEGNIAWDGSKVASTGRFTTDGTDFAAAFGPVKGAAGTIIFTDLLNLVTAPDQRLRLKAINPGIEVNDGEVSYELRPGNVLAVNGAEWPFLGGRLTLEPSQMRIGEAETRRFTFKVAGLDAAKFIQQMNMSNISATGIFDGSLPMVFDQNGGRIEAGGLFSRPPGGNVSYVGALSYKEMSTMANFAFDALKSIDYRKMQIDLNGDVAGEMVTRVSFDGIRQGTSAKRNFLTRQIARLPIRFNVNLKAPFFKMVSSLRSLYDPSYVPDPRALGLVDNAGRPLGSSQMPPAQAVQPPVSGARP